jgi:NAD(P)-dependent dehydrogenase (short-subunit alcohol dehydrogenase family)
VASDGTRIAIVTGGAGGLGRVIGQRLSGDGFLASWLASQRCSAG